MEKSDGDKADVKVDINYYYCEEERLEDEDPVEQDPAPDAENEDVYQCSSCNFQFSSVEEHLRKYHSEPSNDIIEVINSEPATSDQEEDESDSEAGLAFVVKNESGMYECSECSRTFKGLKCYVKHVKTHENFPADTLEDLEQCVMKKENSGDSDTEPIIKFINGTHVFCCTECNAEFKTKKQLKLHISIHKNVDAAKRKWNGGKESSSFDCKYCNKSFANKFDHDLHIQAHEERLKNEPAKKLVQGKSSVKGVHKCQYCGKEFKRPHEKVKHERVHTGEKPFACDLCGKRFRVTYCLSLHKRNVHSEDRPYICTFEGCNKRFKAQSVYNHHINTHSEEKKYKCQYCSKCFKTSVQLIGHRKTHLKPFACQICKRTFSALYAVKNHMATHQTENSSLKLTCNICGATYGRAFALKDHLKTAHPGAADDDEEVGESFIIETEIDMNNDDSEMYSVVMDADNSEQILGE